MPTPDEKAITDAKTASKLLWICGAVSLFLGLAADGAIIALGSDYGSLGIREYTLMLFGLVAGVVGFALLYAIASVASEGSGFTN